MSFDGDKPQKWLRIQRLAYCGPQTKSSLLTVFKIVLLEYSLSHSFTYCLQAASLL